MNRENHFNPSNIRTGGKSLVCTAHAAFALRADGTVAAAGENRNGECDVQDWRDIVALACSDDHTVGLRRDGTVVATGLNEFGECEVSGWSDVVAITCSSVHTVGLRADGTVVATGANTEGQCEVEDMSDIAAVASGAFETIGVLSDGSMVATRPVGIRLELNAREAVPLVGKEYGGALLSDCTGHIYTGMCIDYSGRGRTGNYRDIVAVSCGDCHVAGILSNGRVEAQGKNNRGQCDVDDFQSIIDIACGPDYTAGLKEDGTIIAAGNTEDFDFDGALWRDIAELGGGDGFIIGVKTDGTAVMTGTEERKMSLGKEVAAWSGIDPGDKKGGAATMDKIHKNSRERDEIPMETETRYDILVNDDNEILISIREREGEPQNPVLVYAGGEHALLYRNEELIVILDFIHTGVRDLLYSAKDVLIVELREGALAREYMVPVRQVDALPVPDEKLPELPG